MIRTMCLTAAAALALAAPASAQMQQRTQQKQGGEKTQVKPEQLAQWLYQSNQMEVRFGELAAKQASSPQVKQFGQMLVQDHKQVLQKLEQIGQTTKWNVKGKANPWPASKEMSQAKEQTYEALQKLEGEAFDPAFLSTMVMAHDMTIHRLENAMPMMQGAQDPGARQLAQFLQQTMPTLREHRQQAYQMLGRIGPATAGTTEPGMGTGQPGAGGAARTGAPQPGHEQHEMPKNQRR